MFSGKKVAELENKVEQLEKTIQAMNYDMAVLIRKVRELEKDKKPQYFD